MPVLTPASVFRKYETDGVPDSGSHDPVKGEIIQLLELLFGVAVSGAYTVQTKAALDAITPDDEEMGGIVLNDPDPTKNGYYYRSAGVWVKGRGFPDTFARLTNVDGTPNAVTASVETGVNPADAEMMVFIASATNTGAMTLSVSGETPKPLVAYDGTALAAGYVLAGTPVLFYDDGTGSYRLLLDHRFQVLAEQVENDAGRAESARARAEAAQAAAEAAAGGVVPINFPNRAGAEATSIDVSLSYLRLAGFSSAGDGGDALYRRVDTEPSHAGKFQSADGSWWELAERTITPEMFGARPGDDAFNSGPAIQLAYDVAFEAGFVKAVRHSGHYYSEQSLSPTLAQGSGDFSMPYDLEFDNAVIEFVGTGHTSEVAWYVTNNTTQKGVRYGRISGSFRVLNSGDWRDGISLKGCNAWVNAGHLMGGGHDNSTGGATKAFTRHQIRFESNNGKGGLWNDWGMVSGWGGLCPIYVTAVANANSFSHVYGAYGSDIVSLYNGGDRNTIQHLSGEMDAIGPKCFFENGGAQTVVTNFEFEKASEDDLVAPPYIAAIWCVAGSLSAKGAFYALSTGPYYQVETGAMMDLTHINELSATKRFERIVVPDAWERTTALRSKFSKAGTTISDIGVSGVYGGYTIVANGNGVRSVLPLRVYITNNTNQSVTFDVRVADAAGNVSAGGASYTIAAGAGQLVPFDEMLNQALDGAEINAVQIRARTSAASFTGTATVSMVSLKL